MISRSTTAFIFIGLFVATSSASALTFTVPNITVSSGGSTNGSSTATIPVGGTVSVDVLMLNDASDGVAGLGATFFGFSNTVLDFTSGLAVETAFNTSLFFGIVPANGIANSEGTAGAPVGSTELKNPRTIDSASIRPDGAVRFFNGVTVTPQIGFAQFDSGIIPALIDSDPPNAVLTGDVHARLTFSGLAAGTTTITIGTDGVNGVFINALGAQTPTTNATVTVTVPEPGSVMAGMTALVSVFSIVGIRRSRI